jgi:hypothetical protein
MPWALTKRRKNSIPKNVKKNKTLIVKTYSVASTRSHGKYLKYVTFLWLPVVTAESLHSSGCYWL